MTQTLRTRAMPIRFERWRLGSVVGVAVGHEVRLAHHSDDDSERVALKRTMPGASRLVRESMMRERLALSRVSSDHVVAMVASGAHGQVIWNATQWVDGVDLLTLLKHEPLAPTQVLTIIADLAQALADCHEVDVLHGDLAPTNIVVDLKGRVRLIDFGLSDSAGAPSRPPASGTPAYLDPEAALGAQRHARSDIYSVGLLWARALLGESPRKGTRNIAAQLTRSQRNEALDRAGQHGRLLQACLELRAALRPTAAELLAALATPVRTTLAQRIQSLWRPPEQIELLLAAEDRGERLTDPAGETVTSHHEGCES